MPHMFDKVTCSITVYLKIISKIMECLSFLQTSEVGGSKTSKGA